MRMLFFMFYYLCQKIKMDKGIRMNLWKKTLLGLSCSALLLLTACNDDNDPSYTSYLGETRYEQVGLEYASRIQIMKYSMPNVQDEKVTATALVMLPHTPRPRDGWRIVVWEHGTVGSGDHCAPSKNPLNPRFSILANSLLAAGYVIVAPDYEGLGEKGIHPYLNLKSAAQSALSAVTAYKERYAGQVQGGWMSVGQSQGGHASLATAEYTAQDQSYLGAVAAAPASSLGYIIKEISPKLLAEALLVEQAGLLPAGSAAAGYAELLAYAAYTLTGIQAEQADFDYRSIFQSRSQHLADAALGSTGDNGLCLPDLVTAFSQDILAYVQENPTKTVLDYPGLIANFDENAVVAQFLMDNQPATQPIETPVMIVQGKLDMAVPYMVTAALAQDLEAMGTDVELHLVEGATHTQAIVMKNDEIVQFIQRHMPAQ